VTFEDTQFIRTNFDVVKYWATAAGFGLAIPAGSFVVAMFWWLKCQHLWKCNKERWDCGNIELGDLVVDWTWVT